MTNEQVKKEKASNECPKCGKKELYQDSCWLGETSEGAGYGVLYYRCQKCGKQWQGYDFI